jgi:acetolactate synthase-1/2/3 large subunit
VKFGRYTSSGHLGCVDHAAIARACGGRGETISSASELDAALKRASASETVALLDVATDPGAHPPISLYDGKLDRATSHGVFHEAVA